MNAPGSRSPPAVGLWALAATAARRESVHDMRDNPVSGWAGNVSCHTQIAASFAETFAPRVCSTAPEVLSGGPYNHAADWWSLGITLFSLATGEVTALLAYILLALWRDCVPTPFFFAQFPLPAELDHNSMLGRVRDFPYDLPKTLSSALALLLREVPSRLYLPCHVKPVNFAVCSLSTPPARRSFCAKTRTLDFGTWSVSRCSHFSAALPLTLSSFGRNPSTSSSDSGITLTGRLLPREELRTSTGLQSFSLLTVTSFRL